MKELTTEQILLLSIAIVVVMAIYADWEEKREYRKKHGFSKRDFNQFKKQINKKHNLN